MSCSEWIAYKLEDFIILNPPEILHKGQYAKKISMENIKAFTRNIDTYEVNEYKGGSKFRNGDTLFARITPCLENGKTSQVSLLEDNEVGFGSTEFIVLRNRHEISDKDFIYYLAISPKLRDIAIKSMVGTSGRQRVQQGLLQQIEINLPPLPEQRAIAATLSCLDDMIELNNQTNKVLEEIAKSLFKHWFVDFEFPDENDQPYKSNGGGMVDSELGPIPKGWRILNFNDVCNIKYGKNLPSIQLKSAGYPVFGGNGIIGYFTEYLYSEPQILISCRGAASGKVITSYPYSFITNNSLVLEVSKLINYEYLKYFSLNYPFVKFVTGSAQPQITIENLKLIKMLVPNKSILDRYKSIIAYIESISYSSVCETKKLASIRDSLLPKLMSGEIRVPC